MLIAAAALAFGLLANDDHDLDLAAALARRGWVELAEEMCARIEKNPASSASAKAGVPLVLAEVAIAKARFEADVLKAAKDLDVAVARLIRPGAALTLDERGMIGWLHVQKSRILSAAAEDDPARRPDAVKAWEATEAFYRGSIVELKAMPTSRPVDEALLEEQLELPKALSALARLVTDDPARRKKLLRESIDLLAEFGFNAPQPIVLEALLEEARSRAEAEDYARAEMRFRSMPGMAKDLRKRGFPASEYLTSLLQSGVLGLVKTLTLAKKTKEAAAACDEFLRDNQRLAKSPIGHAVLLAKAEALFAGGNVAGAIDLAQIVISSDPDGAAGRTARERMLKWTAGRAVPPDLLMSMADGLMERGLHREALGQLRRCAEVWSTAADRAKFEPVASYKRGECFRALKQDAEAVAAFKEVFRKYPAHELAKKSALEAVRALRRTAAVSGDQRDAEQMEKLLDEVEKLGQEGESKAYLLVLRAELLEDKKQFKAAADLLRQVDETCEVFDDAMVSAGHCYRVDAEQRSKEDVSKQLAVAETLLQKVLGRKESHRIEARLLFTARYELAMILLHEQMNRPKDAIEHLRACRSQLPSENPLSARLRDSEIQALLMTKDLTGAAAALDQLISLFPDAPQTLRACRRVAVRLEPTDLPKAAQYYRFWLSHSAGLKIPGAEIQTVAEGLYRVARAANRMDENMQSILDLRGKPVLDRTLWQDAARAHEMLIAAGLPEKDADLATLRLAWCRGMSAQTADEWDQLKGFCEKVVQQQKLLLPNGQIRGPVLAEKPWLAALYLEYGHALFQLGKAGQKFQYGNSLTAFNQMLGVAGRGMGAWWISRYYTIRILYERGEGRDLKTADGVLDNLVGEWSNYDDGKYGLKDLFTELRKQVKSAVGTLR